VFGIAYPPFFWGIGAKEPANLCIACRTPTNKKWVSKKECYYTLRDIIAKVSSGKIIEDPRDLD
jgi:hypothetical protein